MVMGYRLDGRSLISSRGIFLYSTVSRLAVGALSVCYPIGIGGFFLGSKAVKTAEA
jgi:hypothetical protein